ncbi:restriction endonuclease subunit S [Cyclobacterium sp. 1_MG-2023]|uniref:restriction endonuclease subunit S n=1 Tax=Cyclobacterium sp. 1_MG-2023 TaxID=3062681 RepID=UPI0026E46990|nr:restriction endonuclease subunit S [Cyclobacterium sp. 1_MG-2023]MDO6436280.1 restriction endonuclease subunit S [Cyclobacterium sp. 1_MG-2023]
MKNDWIEVELGEVADIISGKNQKEVENPNGEFPIYGSGGVFGFADQYLCPPGTTVIGRKGTINNPIFVNEKFWNVDTAFGIHPFEYVLPKLLFYFCKGFNFKKLDKSTTIPSLAKRDLLKIDFPLIPLPEQRAIVARIEELFSELDHAIANLKSAQAKIEIYRQAVLKKAFEGGFMSNSNQLTNAFENWKRIKLGEIIKVSSGKGLTSNQMDGGKFAVYGGNGKNGNHSEYLFEDQKLIIGRVGVRCGVTHITLPFSWVTDNALVVEFKEGENHSLKFMKLKLEFENLNKLSNSTAQPVVSGSKIYQYEIDLPGFLEQNQIVQQIESRFSVADKLAETIQTNLLKSESLRQSILKKAFKGKLLTEGELESCRKEADWEPAEKLLERIKNEKSKAKKS